MTESITQVLSCEEIHAGFDVLIARIGELAAGRNHALGIAANALEAACQLQQERDRAQRKALLQERLANSLRAELDACAEDKRLLAIRCEKSAATIQALEQQIDRMQNPPEPQRDDHTRRWPFKRIGNRL